MAFETFKLKQVIETYNTLYPSYPLDVNTTFGLEVFSSAFHEVLSHGFELYHQVYYLHAGFQGKRIGEYRMQLENSKSLAALKKLVSERKKAGNVANNFLMREQIAKENPSLNEGFAHYTHEALLGAYDHLRILENNLRYALHQIKQGHYRFFRRIPSYISQTYLLYLNNQLAILKEEDAKLTRAMMARLRMACEEPSLQHGDILYHFNPQQLIEDKLTESHFHDFCKVIQRRGETEIQEQLFQFNWARGPKLILRAEENSTSRFSRSFWNFFQQLFQVFHGPFYNFQGTWSNPYHLAKIETTLQCLKEQSELKALDDKLEEVEKVEKINRNERSEKNKKIEKNENLTHIQLAKEKLVLLLSLADKAEVLAREKQRSLEKAYAFYEQGWRRFFSKKEQTQINLFQQWLSPRLTTLKTQKAQIQHKIECLDSQLKRFETEAKLLALLKPDNPLFTEGESQPYKLSQLNELVDYCNDMNPTFHWDNQFLRAIDKAVAVIFENLTHAHPQLLLLCTRLIEVLRSKFNSSYEDNKNTDCERNPNIHKNPNSDESRLMHDKKSDESNSCNDSEYCKDHNKNKKNREQNYDLLIQKKEEEFFVQEIEFLQDLLLSSLVKRFAFSKESVTYLMHLKDRMLEKNISEVKNLPHLTASDKAFLGLYEKGLISLFFYDDRKIVSFALTIIVGLALQQKAILKTNDLVLKNQCLHKAKTDIYRYFDQYGSPEIQHLIKTRIKLCTTKPK